MLGSLFKSAVNAVDNWATETPGKPKIDYTITHPVPGLQRALDYVPKPDDPLFVGKPLASAVLQVDIERGSNNGALLPLTTVRERTMLQYMCSITDRPNWHKKIFDARIVYKWRLESAKEIEAGLMPMLTNPMFEYCIAELQHIARHVYAHRKDGALIVFSGNIVRSDEAISRLLKRNLQLAVKPLEHIPKPDRDWRPGWKKVVLDLVQPSLFPLVYGTSKILDVGEKVTNLDDCVTRCGQGKQVKMKEVPPMVTGDVAEAYSTTFQWLPCEVDISGDEAKIISYINNLHPRKHADLYSSIEKIIDAVIPLWELSLAPLYDPTFQHFRRITIDKVEYNVDAIVQGGQVKIELPKPPEDSSDGLSSIFRHSWASSMPGDLDPEAAWDKQNVSSVQADSRDDEYDIVDEAEDDYEGSHIDSRDGDYTEDEYLEDDDDDDELEDGVPTVIQPEPKPFSAVNHTTARPISFKRMYGRRGRPLQIIVELFNIELTPRRQKFPGRIWQLQGKQNEHIVATALYDYSSSNITPSRLGFRQFVDADSANEIDYEQDEYRFLRELFGCQNGAAGVQNVGTVEAREGRLLTFPNILQYQMQPFKLMDPRRKGHRKVLALYLVDPNVRILSTANVPCQQMDWWRETLPPPECASPDSAGASSSGGNRRDSMITVSTAKSAARDGHGRVRSAFRATLEKGLAKLPNELKDHVFGQVDGFPMTILDARNWRADLMKERKKFVKNHQREVLNSNAFSLHEAATGPVREYDSD